MRVKYRILVYQQIPNPILEDFLKAQNYLVISSTDDNIERLLIEDRYDLALLEEPKEGPTFKYIRLLRKYFERKPAIFMSALMSPETVLEGFKEGLTDYVIKPCNYLELAARIKAHLKYVTSKAGKTLYKFGNFTLDAAKHILTIYDPATGTNKDIPIRAAESRILSTLCSYDGALCPRKAILEGIWGEINYFNSRSLDVSLVYIRKTLKLDPRVHLVNHRRQGYRLYVDDPTVEPEVIEIKKGAD